MVNNSTNIKKNEHSSLTSNHWTEKRPRHLTLEIKVLSWDRY